MKLIGLKHARNAMGWTQEQLAERMGVHPMTVSRWESGIRNPDLGIIRRLSDVLHVTANDLLDSLVTDAPDQAKSA